jgi:hypothetical protein
MSAPEAVTPAHARRAVPRRPISGWTRTLTTRSMSLCCIWNDAFALASSPRDSAGSKQSGVHRHWQARGNRGRFDIPTAQGRVPPARPAVSDASQKRLTLGRFQSLK